MTKGRGGTSEAFMNDGVSRRGVMIGAVAGAAAAALGNVPLALGQEGGKAVSKGRGNQSVCQWCFSKFSVEELAKNAVSIGLKGIDLVGPEHFATLKKYNLIGTMTTSHPINPGLNRKENWGSCLAAMRKSIDASAEAGFPSVI